MIADILGISKQTVKNVSDLHHDQYKDTTSTSTVKRGGKHPTGLPPHTHSAAQLGGVTGIVGYRTKLVGDTTVLQSAVRPPCGAGLPSLPVGVSGPSVLSGHNGSAVTSWRIVQFTNGARSHTLANIPAEPRPLKLSHWQPVTATGHHADNTGCNSNDYDQGNNATKAEFNYYRSAKDQYTTGTDMRSRPRYASVFGAGSVLGSAYSDSLVEWCGQRRNRGRPHDRECGAEPYPAAAFNNGTQLQTYTHAQYVEHLQKLDPKWSEAETDYLMMLCAHFDLNFHVINDRYHTGTHSEWPLRSLEDLKERYYSVGRELVKVEYQVQRRMQEEKVLHKIKEAKSKKLPVAAYEAHLHRTLAELKDEYTRRPLTRFKYSASLDKMRKQRAAAEGSEEYAREKRRLLDGILELENRIGAAERKKRDTGLDAAARKKVKKKTSGSGKSTTDQNHDALNIEIEQQQLYVWQPGVVSASAAFQKFATSSDHPHFNVIVEECFRALNLVTVSVWPKVYNKDLIESYRLIRLKVAILARLRLQRDRLKKEKEVEAQRLLVKKLHVDCLAARQGAPAQ